MNDQEQAYQIHNSHRYFESIIIFLIKHIPGLVFGRPLKVLWTLYKELEKPIDQELQIMIDEYYDEYLKYGWEILFF